ncbi:MAG: immune inhibitor A [candidate division Zixibacteria bacterium]|nr:immune inhibitor A [candidate division Zixibacteria bacterium]MCI0597222.1 immune inhibitor A [candidate division Zixibacteria bacterium]
MRKIGVWLAVLGVLNVPLVRAESLVRVPITSKRELLQMLASGLDVAYVEPEGKFVDLVADSSEILELKFLGFSPFVAVPDLRAQGAGLLGASMGGYHTYAEVKIFLDSIAAARPDLVSPVFSIGQSLEGREIWGVKLSNLPNGKDGRPEVLYTALTHAREPAGMEVLLYTIRHLLQNYGSDSYVNTLLNTRDLYFLPVLNPDGYVYNQATNPSGGGFWRKNRRPNAGGSFGVDLNRNFGYLWGLDDFGSSPNPANETYRGTAPFSEPETQRLRDFVLSQNFTFEIDYHAYSNLWLFPWGYGTEPAEDYWLFRALADSAVLHNAYFPGPGWQLYLTNGTSIDWSYGADSAGRTFSFTPEVGGPNDGFWPPIPRIPVLAAENLMPNLFFAWAADNPRKILPPEPPEFLPLDTLAADGTVELEWKQTDAGNPAAGYRLKISTGPQIAADSALNAENWELVDFTIVPSADDSAQKSFFSGANPGSISVMDSKNAYLVRPGDTLRAETYYNIEPYFDYAYGEVSTDGGKSFHPLAGNHAGPDGSPYNREQKGITASPGVWTGMAFPLDGFVGQKVRFRFSYFTDLGYTPDGIYLRNIYPVFCFAKDTALALPAESTFLYDLDAPGEYYFSIAAVDSQGQTGRYGDWIKSTAGFSPVFMDLNGDGRAAPADLILELNYVFLGLSPPHHPQRGDANGDGQLSSADAVLFLNFIFLGQAP